MLLTISCELLSPKRSTSCDMETSLILKHSYILFKTLSIDSIVFHFFLVNKRQCFIHNLKTPKIYILRSIYFKPEISQRSQSLEYFILELVKYMYFVNPKFMIWPPVLFFHMEFFNINAVLFLGKKGWKVLLRETSKILFLVFLR